MTVHIKLWVIVLVNVLTVGSLYWFIGKEVTAVYCMLLFFSALSWWYQYVCMKKYISNRDTKNASKHLEKHDMSA